MPKNSTKEKKESWLKSLLEILVLALIIIGVYFFLFTKVFSNDAVSGDSMQTNFQSNDRVISVRNTSIHRGDVVILRPPHTKNVFFIKRVIGLPGDTVKSVNDVMYINGKKLPEPYLKEGKRLYAGGYLYTNNFSLQSLHMGNKVPKDSYFVMGDHRNISRDSRMIGYIKRSRIVGVVKLRYWPLNQMRVY